jgi:hypothetical protein
VNGVDLARLADAELELALRDLGRSVAARPLRAGVDPARAARLRLETGSSPRAWRVRPFGRPARRAVLFALAALLLLAAVAAALGLGLPGLRIIFLGTGSNPPTAAASGAGGSPAGPVDALGLGRIVALDSLDADASFDVLLPNGVGLEAPIAAVRNLPSGVRQASLVYAPTERFPAGPEPTVAILITQLPATLDDRMITKFIASTTTYDVVSVAGHAGVWIAGGLHAIGYVDANDNVLVDTIRLAGNVLAWNANGITYRIEGAADLEVALEIALSLR